MLWTKRGLAEEHGFTRYEVECACESLKIEPIVGALANGRAHGLTPEQEREIVAWVLAHRRKRRAKALAR